MDVAQIFAEIFELDHVSADTDFFELGGDSMIAASLINEIERRFGVGLSISVLMDASTPATLAQAVLAATRERSSRTLLPLRASGRGPTILCVHGQDGESFFPHRLNAALRQDRPILGFRARGLEEGELPLTAVEGIAAAYTTTMLEARPDGQFVVLGHCGIGAMIAWEMAQILLAQQKDVAGLIIIDPAEQQDRAPFLHKSGLALEVSRSRALKRVLEQAARAEAQINATAEERRHLVGHALYEALPVYVPAPIACPVLLICIAERKDRLLDRERGYQHLAKDIEVFVIDSSHADLFDEHFESVVGTIVKFLDRVAPLAPQDGSGER